MTEHIGLYVQGLILVFAWMEVRYRVSGNSRWLAGGGRADRVLAGLSPYLLFLLLLLVARPEAATWQVGLAWASLALVAGHTLVARTPEGSTSSVLGEMVLELIAYGILVASGLSIQFAHSPTGGLLYFTAGAPIITCLWLFAFSRVLRLATLLPGLFEGMLAMLAYLFMGSLYLQRQVPMGTYAIILLFAGVTTGQWVYGFALKPSRTGSLAAACWAMTAGALSIVGTSKRLAFLSVVPPTLVLLAPVFFFSYLIVGSYLMPKLGSSQGNRVAHRWNITRHRIVTVLLLFCLVGNLLALLACLTGDPFLILGPGVFAFVLMWKLVSFLVKNDRQSTRPAVVPETISILGVPVWARTESDLLQRLQAMIRDGKKHVVVTPDSLAIHRSLTDERYRAVINQADICVPDGAGVVWAGDFLYDAPILSRIPGVELMERLLAMARDRGFSVYFLGASPAVIAKAREQMVLKYPGLDIVGARDGFFTAADEDALVAEINALAPDMIFVGLGVPKQEMWISANLPRLKTSLLMGVGGTFDVLSGEKARAPLGFQRLGLEWLYRLLCEPHRFKRIVLLPFFVLEVLKEKLDAAS
ncbi:MAG: WecB/TagA/CpsF family glycosyltransferase [Candidatus Riflebacteria bacterium]|nr:WecB/TagA/CpsF family glycosyltransferase [Candidatus Riflebacteria bacterium]